MGVIQVRLKALTLTFWSWSIQVTRSPRNSVNLVNYLALNLRRIPEIRAQWLEKGEENKITSVSVCTVKRDSIGHAGGKNSSGFVSLIGLVGNMGVADKDGVERPLPPGCTQLFWSSHRNTHKRNTHTGPDCPQLLRILLNIKKKTKTQLKCLIDQCQDDYCQRGRFSNP